MPSVAYSWPHQASARERVAPLPQRQWQYHCRTATNATLVPPEDRSDGGGHFVSCVCVFRQPHPYVGGRELPMAAAALGWQQNTAKQQPQQTDRIQKGTVTSYVDWTHIKNDVWLNYGGREHFLAEFWIRYWIDKSSWIRIQNMTLMTISSGGVMRMFRRNDAVYI